MGFLDMGRGVHFDESECSRQVRRCKKDQEKSNVISFLQSCRYSSLLSPFPHSQPFKGFLPEHTTMEDNEEATLTLLNEVFMYKVPPLTSAAGYKANDWNGELSGLTSSQFPYNSICLWSVEFTVIRHATSVSPWAFPVSPFPVPVPLWVFLP